MRSYVPARPAHVQDAAAADKLEDQFVAGKVMGLPVGTAAADRSASGQIAAGPRAGAGALPDAGDDPPVRLGQAGRGQREPGAASSASGLVPGPSRRGGVRHAGGHDMAGAAGRRPGQLPGGPGVGRPNRRRWGHAAAAGRGPAGVLVGAGAAGRGPPLAGAGASSGPGRADGGQGHGAAWRRPAGRRAGRYSLGPRLLPAKPCLARAAGGPPWRRRALVGLGETAVVQGRYEQARPLLEQAVREARAAGSQHLAALALNFVGNGLYLQGDWTRARPVFEQALQGFRSVGNPRGVAVLTVQIGLCALEGGDQHEARSLVREGLQLARQLDFRWGELYGLDGAALLAAREGSWEVAATLLGATELPREASPAPQLGVREAGIAGVTAALAPDSLSALWDKAKPCPWTRRSTTPSSSSSHRIRHQPRDRRPDYCHAGFRGDWPVTGRSSEG
jgi:MalT-like TPR region